MSAAQWVGGSNSVMHISIPWLYQTTDTFNSFELLQHCLYHLFGKYHLLSYTVYLILHMNIFSVQFSSVQLLSHVQLFATPWITAHQASLCTTNSQSLPKLMSIKLVMPSSHLILCCPLLLLPPIPSSIRVFYNESTLGMRWPKYWSFSYNYCIIIVRIFSQYKLSVF